MKSKSFFILLISLFVFFALAIAVSAQGVFDALLTPFGRFDQVYTKFSFFIDTIIYLIIFMGLSKFALGKRFGKEGKAVVVGVGIVLALSLSLFSARAGFNIASFGPVAAIILMALMGYSVWVGIKSLEIEGVDNLTLAAIAYILVYFGVLMAVPGAAQWINEKVPIIGALLALLALGFTVYIIYKMGSFVAALAGAGGKPSGEGDGVGRLVAALPPKDESEAKKQITTSKRGIRYSLVLQRICDDIIEYAKSARKDIIGTRQIREIAAKVKSHAREIKSKESQFNHVLGNVGTMARRLMEARAVGEETIKNLERLTVKIYTEIKDKQDETGRLVNALERGEIKDEKDAGTAAAALANIGSNKEEVKNFIEDIKVDFDQVNDLLAELIAAHK